MRAALVSAIVLVGGALTALLILAALVGKPTRGTGDAIPTTAAAPEKPSSDPGEDFFADKRIPPFELVNQNGEPVTEEIFEDGVVIVDFIFTNCPTICPFMTGVMADLSDRLEDTPVRFVSMSVDPEHDTPEALRAYAGRIGADLDRWSFLTGDYEAVERIVEGALFYNLSTSDQKVTLPDGSEMNFIVHPSKLVLVRPGRDVVNVYQYDDPEAVARLEERARWEAAALGG